MELKYKVGDKALIEVVVINTDEKDERLPYEIEVYGESYWVEESVLEDTCSTNIGTQPTAGNNIEVGDFVSSASDGIVYKVMEVLEDKVYTGKLGYVFKDNIKVIYKKCWEKPKELEEMSKEELIELVKKLKGE